MFEIIKRIWKTGVVTQEPLALAAPPRYRGKLIIDQAECSGCGRCESICPTGAIQLQPAPGGHKIAVSYGKCVFCGLCSEICSGGAISQSQEYRMATRQKSELLQYGG